MNFDESKEFAFAISNSLKLRDKTFQSDFVKDENFAYQVQINMIKLAREQKDIGVILARETSIVELLLEHEKQAQAHGVQPRILSGSEKSKNEKCLEECSDARDCYEMSMDYVQYTGLIKGTKSLEFDKSGLPKDEFREFIESEIARIRLDQSSAILDGEKARNVERIANLKFARELYKERQHELMRRFCHDYPDNHRALRYLEKNPQVNEEPED